MVQSLQKLVGSYLKVLKIELPVGGRSDFSGSPCWMVLEAAAAIVVAEVFWRLRYWGEVAAAGPAGV